MNLAKWLYRGGRANWVATILKERPLGWREDVALRKRTGTAVKQHEDDPSVVFSLNPVPVVYAGEAIAPAAICRNFPYQAD